MNPNEHFETACFEYLKQVYQTADIKFIHAGGMNSTKSDIEVYKNNTFMFYIEAKMGVAQSGQFVILPDVINHCFYFSPRNKSSENDFTHSILSYINSNFEQFLHAGSAGKDINISNDILADWIINYYSQKGVRYIITHNINYIIFPIEHIKNYFNISAVARNKGSGSSEATKKNWVPISTHINSHYNISKINSIREDKKNRLLAYSSILLNHETFQLNGRTYKFSSRQTENEYEIRQLNRKTKNTTVVFSINIKSTQKDDDLLSFKKALMEGL